MSYALRDRPSSSLGDTFTAKVSSGTAVIVGTEKSYFVGPPSQSTLGRVKQQPDTAGLVRRPQPSASTHFARRMAAIESFRPGVGVSSQPSERESIMRRKFAKLDSFLDLDPGWDGEGSIPPSLTDIAVAKMILSKMPEGVPLPGPMVTYEGKVGFFWNKEGASADLEIEKDGTISLYTRLKTGNCAEQLVLKSIVEISTKWLAEALPAF